MPDLPNPPTDASVNVPHPPGSLVASCDVGDATLSGYVTFYTEGRQEGVALPPEHKVRSSVVTAPDGTPTGYTDTTYESGRMAMGYAYQYWWGFREIVVATATCVDLTP